MNTFMVRNFCAAKIGMKTKVSEKIKLPDENIGMTNKKSCLNGDSFSIAKGSV